MVIIMNMGDRNKKIAEIIAQYSVTELVNRQWLDECYTNENRFRNAFCDIKKIVKDVDVAWWYIAYGQSFGKLTDPMHEKMAELCKTADNDVITFQKDLPQECKYRALKDTLMGNIFAIDFNKSSTEIISDIYKIFRSEKFYHQKRWCDPSIFFQCEYKDKCPLNDWIKTLDSVKMPLAFEKRGINSRAFFYFDTLLLVRNPHCSNFNELFAKIDAASADQTKKTIILREILKQVRGITIKVPFFLQKENQFNFKQFDETELIYVDTRAIRVANRMKFPSLEEGIIPAIKKMVDQYHLSANQLDTALYGMGDVCDEKNGCTHGLNESKCIFHDICLYDGKK
jgi:hypothetical protein